MNKIATLSFAVLMLGSSAALAQPYGYGHRYYGQGPAVGCDSSRLRVNMIQDPATGRVISQAEYQARYPWTDPKTWSLDCNTGLWIDGTPQQQRQGYYQQGRDYYQQSQNYDRYRERDRYGR